VTPFIIVCAVMLVAAIAYLAVPLLRQPVAVAKGEPAAPKSTAALVALAVVLPLAAAGLYSRISNFPWNDPIAAAAVPEGHGDGSGASMNEVVQQLQARLASNPSDLEGWQMLGRTYLVTGEAAKAVTAYEKANELSGGQNPELQLDLAEALILTDNPAVQDRAKKIVDAALAADPNNGKALWYSGVMAIRADDKETAKARWTKLLEQNPPEEIRQIVSQQLTELGVQVPAMAASAAPPAMGGMGGGMSGGMTPPAAGAEGPPPSGRTVRVAISVDPKVADKMKPGTVLFVSARQPGIPGPPLAAVRLTSDQLPTTVVLSDANSMMEGRNLSSVDDVEVVARVAFGGTAVTATGDLIGTVQQKKGGAEDVAIVINQVAP
jgi:cytochrome c-type biogenesis protein CcmH